MLDKLKCDDCGRVMALQRLEVLDTGQERPFEKIVSLVQQVLHVPICAVSLVDSERQWFKAQRGLSVSETPREISFCTHAIVSDKPFMVANATEDERFSSNPLVTGEPHIRSYLGIPLRTPDGYNVGTLCAIDTNPREFRTHEVTILENFAKVVMDQLELRQIASTDALTGALSRRAWMEKAECELKRAARYTRPLALLIMDIDHFKAVNDQFGHQVGDVVISRFAELVMGTVRDIDLFGRYGGEEFVALLPETGLKDAITIAERIRTSFCELAIDEAGGIKKTISIGLAVCPDGETNLEQLIERADRALYDAKQGGRNRTVCADLADAQQTQAVA